MDHVRLDPCHPYKERLLTLQLACTFYKVKCSAESCLLFREVI